MKVGVKSIWVGCWLIGCGVDRRTRFLTQLKNPPSKEKRKNPKKIVHYIHRDEPENQEKKRMKWLTRCRRLCKRKECNGMYFSHHESQIREGHLPITKGGHNGFYWETIAEWVGWRKKRTAPLVLRRPYRRCVRSWRRSGLSKHPHATLHPKVRQTADIKVREEKDCGPCYAW